MPQHVNATIDRTVFPHFCRFVPAERTIVHATVPVHAIVVHVTGVHAIVAHATVVHDIVIERSKPSAIY